MRQGKFVLCTEVLNVESSHIGCWVLQSSLSALLDTAVAGYSVK